MRSKIQTSLSAFVSLPSSLASVHCRGCRRWRHQDPKHLHAISNDRHQPGPVPRAALRLGTWQTKPWTVQRANENKDARSLLRDIIFAYFCILFFPSCIFWCYLIPVVFGWAGAKNSKMNNGYRWLQGSQLGILLAAAAFTTRQLWLQGPTKRSVANTTHEWSSWWEIYQWMDGMEWSGVKW